MKNIKLILFFFFLYIFFTSNNALAAKFYFIGPTEVEEGKSFLIQAIISPEEFINALEGEIQFDNRFIEFKSFSDADSLVSLWIEEPQLTVKNTIKFSGIIPGGIGPVVTKESTIFDLNFKAKTIGQTQINFKDSKAYLHQASPEEAVSINEPILINIIPAVSPEEGEVLILDFYPPEPFKIYVTRDPEFFDNKFVAIFSAQDKSSGIDHYEVRELFLGFSSDWKIAKSPYQLLHQSLFSIIQVKAVDKIGHERIEWFVSTRFVFLAIGVMILVLLLLGWLLFWKILKPKI